MRRDSWNVEKELFLSDYKNVHQDVSVLESAGLIVRDGCKVAAPWDALQANVSLIPV
jgi:predicted transcriptional regulator